MKKSTAHLLRELEKGPVHVGPRAKNLMGAARELVSASSIFKFEPYGAVWRLTCSGQGSILWV
jgi:hypothetical protein